MSLSVNIGDTEGEIKKMEPLEIVKAAGAFYGPKEIAPKLLGPTVDYLGREVRGLTQKGIENIKRIFLKAADRLGPRIEESGQVPPKVLKTILNEGYFCEDSISSEYFGGVLASSRSQISRDDRGGALASLIGRLYSSAMGFSDDEKPESILFHSFSGLSRSALVENPLWDEDVPS